MGLNVTRVNAYFLTRKNFTPNPSRFDHTTFPLILAVLAFLNGIASVIVCPAWRARSVSIKTPAGLISFVMPLKSWFLVAQAMDLEYGFRRCFLCHLMIY